MVNLDSLTADLDRISTNPGSSFLNGGPTSLFTGSEVAIGNLPNPFLPATPLPDVKNIVDTIINNVISDVTTFAASYLGEQIGELLSPPSFGDIVSAAQEKTGKYVMSPKEILEKLSKDAEDDIDNATETGITKTLNKLNEDINKHVGEIKTKIDDITQNTCPQWVQNISSYISQGPSWVKAQANMIDKRCCEQIEKQIAQQTKLLKDEKQKVIDSAAEAYARKTANIINENVYDETYMKLKKVVQLQAKAKNLAASAKKIAILNLKALLGL